MKKKIFLLEDDITLNETISEYLSENDYEVVSMFGGYEAYTHLYENSYDLILLDVNVPSLNGFELLKNLRNHNILVPAIFLTSLNSMDDFEKGYESGCDDFLRKPFELKELLLRIKTIIKNGYFHNINERIEIDTGIFYDVNNNTLYKNDEKIVLNHKECLLLKFFLQKQNTLISHEEIHQALWDYDEVFSDNSLRTYIKNLRKIFGKDRIISVKKFGYRFTSK